MNAKFNFGTGKVVFNSTKLKGVNPQNVIDFLSRNDKSIKSINIELDVSSKTEALQYPEMFIKMSEVLR